MYNMYLSMDVLYCKYTPISQIFGSKKIRWISGFQLMTYVKIFLTAPKSWSFNVLKSLLFGKIWVRSRYIADFNLVTAFVNIYGKKWINLKYMYLLFPNLIKIIIFD